MEIEKSTGKHTSYTESLTAAEEEIVQEIADKSIEVCFYGQHTDRRTYEVFRIDTGWIRDKQYEKKSKKLLSDKSWCII